MLGEVAQALLDQLALGDVLDLGDEVLWAALTVGISETESVVEITCPRAWK